MGRPRISRVLALIPARAGSKGIPYKNWTPLAGLNCTQRALQCAREAGIHQLVVSSDDALDLRTDWTWLDAPAPLHTDTCPMIDVVKDALARIPGPPEQIIVLLQPTQPFRKPEHVRQAIDLLEDSGADSVVSVVEIPALYHPAWQATISNGWLKPYLEEQKWRWANVPMRRQALERTYSRDGTVYAFWRKTLASGSLYGQRCHPLVIPPDETCPLDTLADWAEAERRLRERDGAQRDHPRRLGVITGTSGG